MNKYYLTNHSYYNNIYVKAIFFTKIILYFEVTMKKLFIFLIITLSVFCETIDPDYKWYDPKEVIEKYDQLLPGDILILSKGSKFRESWGHSAVLNDEKNSRISCLFHRLSRSTYTFLG